RHHLDLYSFPTRRSSDLVTDLGLVQPSITNNFSSSGSGSPLLTSFSSLLVSNRGTFTSSAKLACPRSSSFRSSNEPTALPPLALDRKSTRLNSSHGSISY